MKKQQYIFTYIIILSLSPFQSIFAKDSSSYLDIDISKLDSELCLYTEWESKRIGICHRSNETISLLKNHEREELGDPEGKEIIKSISNLAEFSGSKFASPIYSMQDYLSGSPTRSLHEDIIVIIASSPYNGCATQLIPETAPGNIGNSRQKGFLNPCIGETYDMAGRVIKSVKSNKLGNYWNLRIPPYKYLSPNIIRIGELPENIKQKEYDFSPDLHSKLFTDGQRLFFSSIWDNRKLALELLKKGVNPNKVKIAGVYPLHMSVLSQNYEMTKILLENGADPEITNYQGHKPEMFAEVLKNKELLNLLRSYEK